MSRLIAHTAPETALTPADLADLIRNDPKVAEQFEQAYANAMRDAGNDDGVLGPNPRTSTPAAGVAVLETTEHNLTDLIAPIIDDLFADTWTWSTADLVGDTSTALSTIPPAASTMLTAAQLSAAQEHTSAIAALDSSIRPQATATAMQRDIDAPTGALLASMLMHTQDENSDDRVRRSFYNRFRQGLDILDLDSIAYQMIDMNPDSMSHWLPQLAAANALHQEFRIPETTIARAPLSLLQLPRLGYSELNATTHEILNRWAERVFALEPQGDYFVKTGTFSSKFDFRNARVVSPSEVAELGDYLVAIHEQALQMASPLNERIVYGAGTTTEWVVREFIPDTENSPTIYHGLPLRCEFRVFVDCDNDTVLTSVPYWESKTMRHRFAAMEDADHPDNRHDLITYLAAEPKLKRRFKLQHRDVERRIERLLPDLDLTGQWSIDVMADGPDLWLIDMAQASSSAFFDRVPTRLRQPAEDPWSAQIAHALPNGR